jgi:hypothetical protein
MAEDKVRQRVKKTVKEIDMMISERFTENLEIYNIPVIKDIILATYDNELSGRVTDRRARTNPMYYRDEFAEALDNWEWTDTGTGFTKLITPATDTFNWNQGRLRIIENIVEGTIGKFVEVDEEQYVAMFNKRPILQPFDRAVPRKERIYLLRLSSNLRRRWRETSPRKGWVEYPFSNTSPTDIFYEADQYVMENMQGWINETIKEVTREVGR